MEPGLLRCRPGEPGTALLLTQASPPARPTVAQRPFCLEPRSEFPPQILNSSFPGYFRLVLNKRSRFIKKCCHNTQPAAFSPSCVCNSHAFSLITFNV